MYEFYFWFIWVPVRSLWLRWKYRNETPEETRARRDSNETRFREAWAGILEEFKDRPEDREMIEARMGMEECLKIMFPAKEEKAQNVVDKS